MSARTLKFAWDKRNTDGTSNFFSFDVDLERSTSDDYGYNANKICTSCQGKLEQTSVCTVCGTVHISDSKNAILKKKLDLFNGMKTFVGKITMRKDEKSHIIFDDDERKMFVERATEEMIHVVEEININGLLPLVERFEKTYEVYSNELHNAPILIKVRNYLEKYQKALVCQYGLNSGKSNRLGGLLMAGKDKLLLVQLLDYRLVRPTHQEGVMLTSLDATPYSILDEVSENKYPELIQNYLNMVEKGEKIDLTPRPAEKIEVTVPELTCLD